MSALKFVLPVVVVGGSGAFLYNRRQQRLQTTNLAPQSLSERFRSYASIGDGRCMVLEDFILSCCAVAPPPPASSSSSPSSDATSSQPTHHLVLSPSAEQLFKSIDADGDGTIDFGEYCVLATFLSNSDAHFRTAFYMFDADKSGRLDIDEFRKVMTALCVDPSARAAMGLDSTTTATEETANGKKKSNRGSTTADKGATAAANRTLSVLESSGVVQQMFGKQLDKKLSIDEFLTLVRKLRWEVRRVEFQQYLRGANGSRSRDEAVRLDDVRRMLGVSGEEDSNNNNSGATTTNSTNKNQWVSWTSYTKLFDLIREAPSVQRGLEILQDAKRKAREANGDAANSEEDGGATKLEFARALRAAKLTHFTPQDISMFFDVFDSDGSGTIDAEEFGRVCELRDAFFSAQRPDFSQPERNVAQQFFFCMQQRQ